jgi:hypothetical protein
MQYSKDFLPIAVVIFIISLAACNDKAGQNTTANTNTADTGSGSSTTLQRNMNANRQVAKEGDTVWVIANHVKSDKRQQFERFVHEVFWDSSSKLSSQEEQLVFRQTRVLHPTRQEKDGSYTYLFIMDPYIPGANYDIGQFLDKIYGTPKAAEYMKMLEETQVREQTSYFVVQSRH